MSGLTLGLRELEKDPTAKDLIFLVDDRLE